MGEVEDCSHEKARAERDPEGLGGGETEEDLIDDKGRHAGTSLQQNEQLGALC